MKQRIIHLAHKLTITAGSTNAHVTDGRVGTMYAAMPIQDIKAEVGLTEAALD